MEIQSLFTKKIRAIQEITFTTSEFLIETGLPKWSAPHLYFGSFGKVFLPQLKDWSWGEDWVDGFGNARAKFPTARVLGAAQDNEAIVLLPKRNEVYVFDNAGLKLLFVNSNVQNLSYFLNEFATIVEIATRKDEEAVVECRVPMLLITNFIKKLQDFETKKSVWESWAKELHQ